MVKSIKTEKKQAIEIFKKDKYMIIEHLTSFDISFIKIAIQVLHELIQEDKHDYICSQKIEIGESKYKIVVDLTRAGKKDMISYICKLNNKLIELNKKVLKKNKSFFEVYEIF